MRSLWHCWCSGCEKNSVDVEWNRYQEAFFPFQAYVNRLIKFQTTLFETPETGIPLSSLAKSLVSLSFTNTTSPQD